MRLLFDESLSPKLVDLLDDLFPGSESALRNGLARRGDVRILEYTMSEGLILVTTDSDFETLAPKYPDAHIVVLRECNYPTVIAAEVLRRYAIRIADLARSQERVLILER